MSDTFSSTSTAPVAFNQKPSTSYLYQDSPPCSINSDDSTSTVPVATPRKMAKEKAKSKKTAPAHPSTSLMVNAAIKSLNNKGGSSLQAIKKYIGNNYTIHVAKASIFIRKYLNSAVDTGILVRTRGTGASGSFRLAGENDNQGVAAKPKAKNPAKKKTGATTTFKKAAKKESATKKK